MARTALLSVPDFPGLAGFATRLHAAGWKLIATRNVCLALATEGVPAIDVAEFNGVSDIFPFPPTLHPRMEAALTAPTADRIDLVFDLPYGLDQGVDVGGWTLLELGAKGHRLVVYTSDDMAHVLAEIEAGRSPWEDAALLQALADKVRLGHVRQLAALLQRDGQGGRWAAGFESIRALLWGENPYQAPAFLTGEGVADPLSIPSFDQVSGIPPCFTNLADLDSMLHCLTLVCESSQKTFGEVPFVAAAGKHGNPCGLAISWTSPVDALTKALYGDPVAVWGGEFLCNFRIDDELASLLVQDPARQSLAGDANWMLDLVAVPSLTPGARETLGKRGSRKVLVNEHLLSPAVATGTMWRHVRGGALRQPRPDYVLNLAHTGFPREKASSLITAWAAAFSSSSGGNEIALSRGGRLLSLGGGPSTVAEIGRAHV
jgi:AICAR transformylase/IMP cyclohydrolase PurH